MTSTELKILQFNNNVIYMCFDDTDERYNSVLSSVQESILSDLGKSLGELSQENVGTEFKCNVWWDNNTYTLVKIDYSEDDDYYNIFFYYKNQVYDDLSSIAVEYVDFKD